MRSRVSSPCSLRLHADLFLVSRNLKIGYFSQHHVDQLDLNVSSVELLLNRFPGEFLWCVCARWRRRLHAVLRR